MRYLHVRPSMNFISAFIYSVFLKNRYIYLFNTNVYLEPWTGLMLLLSDRNLHKNKTRIGKPVEFRSVALLLCVTYQKILGKGVDNKRQLFGTNNINYIVLIPRKMCNCYGLTVLVFTVTN